MSTGIYHLLWRRLSGIVRQRNSTPEAAPSLRFKSALIALGAVAVLLSGAGVWLVMSVDDSESADGGLARMPGGATMDDAAKPNQAASALPQTPMQRQAHAEVNLNVPDDRPTAAIGAPPPLNGLKIGSQSWRRGGLGSKALVTFTLRNDNSYAVKDVGISCAFSRSDGSHLTDRTRVVPGPVNLRSRKTFAAVHVGFVNVNASKAKCTLVAASRS